MSLTYRQIQNDKQYRKLIWRTEETFPEWFRNASHAWTPDYKAHVKFWKSCKEIYGLFDNDRLVCALYIQWLNEKDVNVHVSVIEKINPEKIVRFFASLKRHKRAEGVRGITGWIFEKNRHLLEIGKRAGFFKTGLEMSYGADSKGRVLRWIEVRG